MSSWMSHQVEADQLLACYTKLLASLMQQYNLGTTMVQPWLNSTRLVLLYQWIRAQDSSIGSYWEYTLGLHY